MNSHFYEVMGFQAPATAANMLLNAMATEEAAGHTQRNNF